MNVIVRTAMARRSSWFALAAVAGGGAVAWRLATPPDGSAAALAIAHRHPRSDELAAVRRTLDTAALDAFVAEQRARATASDTAAEWRVLAEACLERVLLESSRLGMAVARPTFAKLPAVVAEHLAAGEAAVQRARALGDGHSEVPRIEASLLANRIDGAIAAMQLGRKVDALISEAFARDPGNPHAAVARGCRLIFAPRWLGGDPQRARALFETAAAALQDDERPLVFAAFAAHVSGEGDDAARLLQGAIARNPTAPYAREVARRLAVGEADAFSRDLPAR